jgi:hypothetical protein
LARAEAGGGPPVAKASFERCLERLREAIQAAGALGLSTSQAEAALATVERRLGYPGDTYVLALIGGTGVGKSSLLNRLAGAAVSPVSPERPTTSEPIAWIPHAARHDLEPLLAWLGVRQIHEHDGRQDPVAILDLPDIDSIVAAHRQVVEGLLPKVDAVAWITDPEKYADAVLHDDFLKKWLARLDRQVLVVNKSDRLAAAATEELRRDLDRVLQMLAGERRPRILTTSAVADDGVDPLVEWLAAEAEGKRVIRRRAEATLAATAADLAAAVGISPQGGLQPLLSADRRAEVLQATSAEVLRLVGLGELERRATEAVRARARVRGGGPFGLLTNALERVVGRQRRIAEPRTFLVHWRERGSLGASTSAYREALGDAVRTSPAAIRRAVVPLAERAATDTAIGRAVDRAIASTPEVPPSSRVWSLLGPTQSLIGLAILLAAIWLVFAALLRSPVDPIELPLLGHIPVPLAVLVVLVLATFVLSRVTDLHARWIGRRWARLLASEVQGRVQAQLETSAFAAIDQLEGSRWTIWAVAEELKTGCRDNPDDRDDRPA